MANTTIINKTITDLKIPENRILESNKENISKLKTSINDTGHLLNPILIDAKGNITSGVDRLIAMTELGKTEIPCVVIETTNIYLLKMIEIDENLIRKKITPFEKATLLYEKKKVYELLYPKSTKKFKVANNSKNPEDRVETDTGFAKEMSSQLDCSDKTITNNIAQIEKIKAVPGLEEVLSLANKRTTLKAGEIDTISKLPEAEMEVLITNLNEKLSNNETIKILDLTKKENFTNDNITNLVFMLDLFNIVENNKDYTVLKNNIKIDFEKAKEYKKSKKLDFSKEINFILENKCK